MQKSKVHHEKLMCSCGEYYASHMDELCDKCRGATVHSAKLKVSKNQLKQRKMKGKHESR